MDEKRRISKEVFQPGRHPVRQKFLAGLLCVCLMIVSLPVEFLGAEVLAEGAERKVVSFTPLPEEVREQTAAAGTPLEELNLPDTLEAVCVKAEQADITDDGKFEVSEFSEMKGSDAGEAALEEPQGNPGGNTVVEPQNDSGKDETEEKDDIFEKPENSSLEENQGSSEGEENQGNLEGEEDSSLEEDQEVLDRSEDSDEEPAENGSEGTGEVPVEPGVYENTPELSMPDTETGSSAEPESVPEQSAESIEEAAVIENVTWKSAPEYDSEKAGIYVFTPVFPEYYVLGEGVVLPEIYVTVKGDGTSEKFERRKKQGMEEEGKKSGKRKRAEEFADGAERIEYFEAAAQPGCGVISKDTVWSQGGTLENGELVVNPGVTLTINSHLEIVGNVTIRGGGTIERGSSGARIIVSNHGNLVIKDITLDGRDISSSYSMIRVNSSQITIDDGCEIRNCKCLTGDKRGGAVYLAAADAVFNDCVIANCSAGDFGGAVYAITKSNITINKGIYRNNATVSLQVEMGACGGGFICIDGGTTLKVYGGNFIENTTIGRGGAIYHAGASETETHLYGGVFQGNTSSWDKYAGSGAIWVSSIFTSETSYLDISNDVKFCGDGANSGIDGIYLDSRNSTPRRIHISNTLSHPITLYLKAIQDYVIADGVNDYILLHERDMKKINFVDVGGSGKKWYAVLDREHNQVKISEIDPGYKYFVYYISNGAKGTVTDDKEYDIGEMATVQSADPLEKEGSTFLEWNTEPDGTGTGYQPGKKFVIEGDTDLYAIFPENKKKSLKANFYSGTECVKETKSTVVVEDAESGTVTALELQELEGYEPIGWEEEDSAGYAGEIKPQEEITLSKPETDYYGVYQKEVTLSYQAEGAEGIPEGKRKPCRANVHNEITYQEAEFTVGSGPTKPGHHFVGWNAQEDEKGTIYQPGDALKLTEDMTLYAMFLENEKKNFIADFFSGEAGNKETVIETVEETVPEVTVKSLKLRDLEGFTPVGWDTDPSSYDGEVLQEQDVTLTKEHTSYYGIYQRDVTLTYDSNDGSGSLEQDVMPCRANVHEEITYNVPEFTIASAPSRQAYLFQGWNAQPDGSGEYVQPEDVIKSDSDRTFYAIWEPEENAVPYQVEHYKQDLEGDGYTIAETDTESLMGLKGTEVEAAPKQYVGFHLNDSHSQGKLKGVVEEDGSLVLKLYYDRNVYEVDFSLNGALGKAPDAQKIRYGGLLKTVEDPVRKGYHFKGWHLDDNGLDGGSWDFEQPVENNTDRLQTTLYAIWADEQAPEMERASFSSGYRDFRNWLIKKKNIVVTVPVTEEGSGLAKAEYLLESEDGTEKDGQARITEKHELSNGMLSYGSGASLIRAAQAEAEQGAYEVSFAIDEEFKGKAFLTCTDHAGNVSARKLLTAAGGGIILEENAPEISFSNTKETTGKQPIHVKVRVEDKEEGNVSGGLAGVSYQLDKKKKVKLPEEDFNQELVEFYEFTVKVTGEGTHILRVKAKDNAGNENSDQVKLIIRKEKKTEIPVKPETPDSPKLPGGPEPKTGNGFHVKIYATVAMIAGFGYLLLYFEGEHGITEREKDEIVYRLIVWAKKGGRFRRWMGLAIISLFLAYYHSIGKSVDVELKEVYTSNN
ncbi:MAG: hypothetical protein HFH49_06450 [Lachnospiraceae bacterium]|nr:hypothetical protein [Lachnospiraceae bacterium]